MTDIKEVTGVDGSGTTAACRSTRSSSASPRPCRRFVLVGAVWPEGVAEETGKVLAWITENFGWLFVLTSAGFVLFSAYLALHPLRQHQARARTTPSPSSPRSRGSR